VTRIDIPLIDCHTHIGHLPGAVGDVYGAEDLMYIQQHEGVRFMLTSSASATTVSAQLAAKETLEMVKQYGEHLGGMLWINPHDPTWRDDVDRAKQAGFYGIKLHPVLDHYEVTEAALAEVFACGRENHWPILTHTHVDGSTMGAARYEPLIKAFPEVKLILAHLKVEAIPLAKRYENVFVDTTYMDPLVVEVGVDALGPTKVVFGSDACEGFDVGRTPGRIRPQRSYAGIIQGLRERGLTDTQLEIICFQNAKDVFDLNIG